MNGRLLGIEYHQVGLAGLNDIQYAPSGCELVVAGPDGLKIIDPAPGASLIVEPQFPDLECAPLSAAIDSSGRTIAVAGEDSVWLFNYAKRSLERTLHRSVLPVRHVVFNPLGTQVACACEDNIVRLIGTSDNSLTMLRGHEGPVRSVAWDPQNDYLASSGDDGTVRVWQFCDEATREVHCLRSAVPANPLASDDYFHSRLSFQPPRGDLLAVPGKRSIQLLQRESWSLLKELKGAESDYNGVAWCKNGAYLASYEYRRNILVWDVATGESIHRLATNDPVTSLCWSPRTSAELSFVERTGRFGVWPNVVPDAAAQEADALAAGQTGSVPPSIDALLPTLPSDEEATDAGRKKSRRGKSAAARSMIDDEASSTDEDDDEEEDDEEDDDEEEDDDKRNSVVADDDDDDDDAARRDKRRTGGVARQQQTAKVDKQRSGRQRRQQAFQPGGLRPDDGQRWYLCRSMVGSVICTAENGLWSLEAKFADSAYRGRRWIEHSEPALAALSVQGAVVGCREERAGGDVVLASTVQYRPFDSWGTDTDWLLKLPRGEDVLVAAVGSGWVAAATSRRKLRLLSAAGGVQKALLALAGDPVCCAAHSSAPLLNLVCHAADPDADGTQRLELLQINVDTLRTVVRLPVALAPGARLAWLDFSPSLAPLYADTSDTVYTHEPAYSSEWLPVGDVSPSSASAPAQHRLWPIGMPSWNELICLRTGRHAVPLPSPEPPIVVVPLRMPLCEIDADAQVQKEEIVVRKTIELAHLRRQAAGQQRHGAKELLTKDAARDKLLLELVHAACKDEKPVRALDFCHMLTLHKSFTIASTLALRAHQSLLADRITDIMEARFGNHVDAALERARPHPDPAEQPASKQPDAPVVAKPPTSSSSSSSSSTLGESSHASDFFSPKKSAKPVVSSSADVKKSNPFLAEPADRSETEAKRTAGDSLFSELGSLAKRPRT